MDLVPFRIRLKNYHENMFDGKKFLKEHFLSNDTNNGTYKKDLLSDKIQIIIKIHSQFEYHKRYYLLLIYLFFLQIIIISKIMKTIQKSVFSIIQMKNNIQIIIFLDSKKPIFLMEKYI